MFLRYLLTPRLPDLPMDRGHIAVDFEAGGFDKAEKRGGERAVGADAAPRDNKCEIQRAR